MDIQIKIMRAPSNEHSIQLSVSVSNLTALKPNKNTLTIISIVVNMVSFFFPLSVAPDFYRNSKQFVKNSQIDYILIFPISSSGFMSCCSYKF